MGAPSLDQAILLTVAYSNVFSFPLTKDEIWLRLIGSSGGDVVRSRFDLALKRLYKAGKILEYDGHFSILGAGKMVATRFRRQIFARSKLKSAQTLADFAKKIPFVYAVVVTGSLSTNNTKFNDDIDFLIICQRNRLWIIRPILIFLAMIFGKRRRRDGHHRDNSWCFNMFMEVDYLTVLPMSRNAYTAYEICQAKFIYDRGGVERVFLEKNDWVKRILPNYWGKKIDLSRKNKTLKQSDIGKNGGWVEDLLILINKQLFRLQYSYMKPRMTNESVSLNFAFFHPRDTKKQIKRQWAKILSGKINEK